MMETRNSDAGSQDHNFVKRESMSLNMRTVNGQTPPDNFGAERQFRDREPLTQFDMCGCLLKRRGGFAKHMPNNYNLRFFTLKDQTLKYYQCGTLEEIQGREARGTMMIRPSETSFTVGIPFDHAPSVFTMQLKNMAEEKWKLCAENEADLVRWTTAIHKALGLEDMPEVPMTLHRKFSHRTSSGLSMSSPTSAIASNRNLQSRSSSVVSLDLAQRPSTVDQIKIKKPAMAVNSCLKSGPPRTFMNDPDNREIMMIMAFINLFFFVSRFSILAPSFRFLLLVIVVNIFVFKSMRLVCTRRPIQISVPVSVPHQVDADEALPSSSSSTSNQVNASQEGLVLLNGSLVPIAGGTFKASSSLDHTWNMGDATRFKVRIGPNYDKFKKKAPSLASLYELVATDFISSDYRIDLIHSHVVLPDTDGLETHHKHVPSLLIVNCQIPTETPSVFNAAVDDGHTLQAIFYFKIRQETCDALEHMETASPAIKLFAKYCELAPMDPDFRARFKAIALIDNISEFDLPSFVSAYNGKPGLIRKCSSFSQGPNCLEIDINIHKFAYVAKQGLHVLMTYFHQMYLDLGFVIEARSEEEMPECIFGVARLNKIRKTEAVNLFA